METTLPPKQAESGEIMSEIITNDISVISSEFSELSLSENILKALADMKFEKPSPIQKEAIPQVMAGNDIIAKAPTGSGKTAAFAIPIIEKLDLNPNNKTIQALVLSPTRELAIQVHREFEKLTKYAENVSVVSVYGGQNIERQLNALKREPQIIVATPGRLMDHIKRGSIKLDLVHTVVLDEADEMLDMGFREDIYSILEKTPINRQTILFSATMAKDIMELTKKFQKEHIIVDVMDNLQNIPNIEQEYFEVAEKNKIELMTRLLNLHNITSALVFCNTKSNVDKVVEILKQKCCFADAIHGDMNQSQREKVMRGFRNGSVKILVATDVAGRGIDVKNIDAVFNYDLPRDDEDYIHRVGRTGRAGNSGISFTFISKKQTSRIKKIERANGIQIHKKEIPTSEEIQNAIKSNFKTEIKSIIENENLDECKNNIESMISEGFDLKDIASALLKIYISKEDISVNENVDFKLSDEDNSERKGRRSRGSRGNRDRRSRRSLEVSNNNIKREKNHKDYSSSDKKKAKKERLKTIVDEMIVSVNKTSDRNYRSKKSAKTSTKMKSKFFDNKFNKKSKYKSKKFV